MKSYIKIFASVLLGLTAVSCENFLTTEAETLYSRDSIYADEAGAEAALYGCFQRLQGVGLYQEDMFDLMQNCSGLFNYSGYSTKAQNLQTYYLTPYDTDSGLEDMWEYTYKLIYDCNDVLEGMDDYDIGTEEWRNNMRGDAYLLRALMYFTAVRFWGPVPVHTVRPIYLTDTYVGRSSVVDVYTLILDDLTKAEAMLPEKEDRDHLRRFHKWTATALKVKVFAQIACVIQFPDPYEAMTNDAYNSIDFSGMEIASAGTLDLTGRKISEAKDAWQLAYDIGKDVEQNGPFSLNPSYVDLFDWDNADSEDWYGGVEGIITIANTADGGGGYTAQYSLPEYYDACPDLAVGSNAGRTRPAREVFLQHIEYRETDPRNENEYYDPERGSLTYDLGKDPRIDVTYVYYSYTCNESSGAIEEGMDGDVNPIFPNYSARDNSSSERYPFLRKYCAANYTGSGETDASTFVYRYADVVLTIAEAAAELGLGEESVSYLNQILNRARTTNTTAKYPKAVTYADYASNDDLVTAIMKERLFEFLGEGASVWFDSRRRGVQYFIDNVADVHNDYLYGNREKGISAQSATLQSSFGNLKHPTEYTAVLKILLLAIPDSEITNNLGIASTDQNYGYSSLDYANATDD